MTTEQAPTTEQAAKTEQGAAATGHRPGTAVMVRGLMWDIGLPLVAYYGLHLLGVSDWLALLAATSAAGLVIGWGVLRDRKLNLFATLMLTVFGLGLLLAVVSGDPRFLLVKESVTTAVVGTAFLVTTAWGRPLTLAASQRWTQDRAAEIDEKYRSNPLFRRAHRVSSVVWGLGLLTESLVRIPLVFLLPISVMVGLSTAMMVATIGGLIIWNSAYATRVARRAKAEA